MAFGRKKSKKNVTQKNSSEFDDLDFLTSDEENFSASDYPVDSFNDYADNYDEKDYMDHDYLGIDNQRRF